MTRNVRGTKSPMKKGVLALVVLLLASALLVGAGSAEEPKTVYVTSPDDLEKNLTGVTNQTIIIELSAGTYSFPFSTIPTAGKNITFHGVEGTQIDLQNIATGQSTGGAEITFDNVDILFANENYMGLQHSKKVVYKNCQLTGKQHLYANDVEFTGCTLTNLNDYCLWTYGSKNVTFTDCTFYTGGRCIYVYNEAKTESFVANVTLTNCIFNDDNSQKEDNGIDDLLKGAVETGSNGGNTATSNKYNIVFDSCTVNGFAYPTAGIPTNSPLWGNKHSMDADHLKVTETGTKFTITNVKSTGGAVETDVSVAQKSDSVTVTATPDEGYEISSITVTTSSGAVSSVENGGKFQMPAESVTITAVFVEKPTVPPVAPTISIVGELSAEQVANPAWITLTASLSTGDVAEYKWEVKDSSIIDLKEKTGSTVYYKPLKAGSTQVTVSAGDITQTVTITVFETIAPDFPATSTTTVNEDGEKTTAITIDDGAGAGSVVIDTAKNEITITDTSSGITKVIKGTTVTAGDDGKSATVTGDTEVAITYPTKAAPSSNEVAKEGTTVTHVLSLTLTNDTNEELAVSPEIVPAVVTQAQTEYPDFKPTAMITASVVGDDSTGTKLEAFNKNISTNDGIKLTVNISKEGMYKDAVSLDVLVLHIKGTNVEKAKVLGIESDANNWTVTFSGTSFSSYALQATPVIAQNIEPPKDTGSSSSSGSSVWLTEIPTETPTPTQTPTAQPTDAVPTDIPVTQPTETPASPAFGALAALAGLGAVAVLRRK